MCSSLNRDEIANVATVKCMHRTWEKDTLRVRIYPIHERHLNLY